MIRAITASVFVLALLNAPTALASHSFPADVPDGHQFHTEIGIFKDTNITTGCSATAFCPQDFVRRQAMAAFIDRALGLVVRPGEATQKAVPGSRVALVDDGFSFVGTVVWPSGNRLLRFYGGPDAKVVGGCSCNVLDGGLGGYIYSATIAGGGGQGGLENSILVSGTVGGGAGNRAYGTVPGGLLNTAQASAGTSFAAGRRARATHTASFVWSDGNRLDGDTFVDSPADWSFSAHATGGVNFWTNISGATTGCAIPAGSGSWACTSDRNAKENFRPVDGRRVLAKLAKLPITSWNYKGQKDRYRHIGPTAQDFKAAFGVGESKKTISMVDADGVVLAAIQALTRGDRAQNTRITALARELNQLKKGSGR